MGKIKLVFKKRNIKFAKAAHYPAIEKFENIRKKAWKMGAPGHVGKFYAEDYADFDNIPPGGQITRGAANAELKPVKGFMPNTKYK